MSVSVTKYTPTVSVKGLEDALHLLDMCRDPAKYEEMLKPLLKARDEANEEWAKVKIAGNINNKLEKADKELAKARETREKAEQEIADKKARFDADFAAKTGDLRQRENSFAARQQSWDQQAANQEAELKKRASELDRRERELTEKEHKLEEAQEKLAAERASVEQRFRALKEAFDG